MRDCVVFVALQQFGEDDPRPVALLQDAGVAVRRNTLGRRLRRDELVTALQDADAVLAGVEPYDAEVLRALPRLRCISRCGTGTDSIDLEVTRQRGIAVFTTPEEVVEPVAQMTIAMMLALARQFPQHLANVRNGVWKKQTGSLLSEWTVGLVGFGRIGRAVERYLLAFGSRVLVTDPGIGPGAVPSPTQWRDLPSLLAEADLVSLHVNRPKDAGVLMGRQEFAAMKSGSRLVNTARGYLVDEAALFDALQSGHLAAAALDVFLDEPYSGRLATLPHVLCTPHVASLTRASRAAMEWRCAQNAVDCLLRIPCLGPRS